MNRAGDRTRRRANFACSLCVFALVSSGCNGGGTHAGVLVGDYAVRGVLASNTCGQTGLPAQNPLTFNVEIREDNGLGYWLQDKAAENTGSFSANGVFHFSVSQTKILSMGLANPNPQPSDFTSQQPDFDIRQTTCAVSITETIDGSVQRRDAADGGAVMQLATSADAGANDTSDDLNGTDLIEVTPSAGSDCNIDLTAFGGSFLALPCSARYVLTGTLAASTSNSSMTQQTPATAGTGVVTAGSGNVSAGSGGAASH